VKPHTCVSSVLAEIKDKLNRAGTPDPGLESELILAEATGIPRLELLLARDRILKPHETRKAISFLLRRVQHEPLQYIFGKAYFRNLVLKVGPDVLVPRPETELLVELAMKLAPKNSKVLDIATGSGAIALSLAQERPDLKVYASDISPAALWLAKKNRLLNKTCKINFRRSDLLKDIRGKFCVITANLPYISAKSYAALPREIRRFEPKSALIAGKDGLKFISRLIAAAHKSLEPDGHLILEISPEQKKQIICFFKDSKKYSTIEFKKDLCGKIRFCILKK